MNTNRNKMGGVGIYLVVIAVIAVLYFALARLSPSSSSYSYSNFLWDVQNGYVSSVLIKQNSEVPTGVLSITKTDNGEELLNVSDVHEIEQLLLDNNIRYTLKDVTRDSVWITTILPFGICLVIIIIIMMMTNRQAGGGGGAKMMNFGKSRAKLMNGTQNPVTFKDVAGLQEEKEELEEIVDFLKNPVKYTELGARIPKGVILTGPPGTGKTLLAKAVAGEANVPFFSLSGSEFVEMFVGVGASRVRDLFRKANNMAPCIIFIDEIDAIGGKRDTRHGGGDSEREQTLNQLLSEMDGFDSSKGIIVLAATNRPEVLDKALLRPGRFDRRIIVSKPDMQGRIDTLKVHSKNVKMDETVDFKELALATSGAVGADLANIINEAALMAVRNKRDYVSQKDLIASVEVVFAGKEKKEKLLSPREKKIVAYHEVGHALVAALQKNTLPIQRITIVPRTSGALGYVWQVPEEEKQLQTKKEMEEDIVTFLAGRAAEELKFDSVTNGASNDIEKATSLARTMITMYGMSEKFGMVQLEGVTGEYLDNRRVLNCSSETETKVDTEVKNMMKASYEKAYKLLKKNMPTLDAIAQVLYEKENLSGKEFMELYEKYQNVKLTEAEKVQ